jgi:ribosome maturation factor RimP
MKRIKEQLKEKINFVLKSLKGDFSLLGLNIEADNGTKILRIFVDSPSGITIDDCVHISEKLSVHLKVSDFILEPYRLEVSSPGAENKEAR